MNTNKIIRELTDTAHSIFPRGGGEVFLYGSRARGDSRKDSDWDLLVIIDDDKSTSDDFKMYAFPFTEIGWKYGEQITPLYYTRSEWEAKKNSLFFHNVSNDAVLL